MSSEPIKTRNDSKLTLTWGDAEPVSYCFADLTKHARGLEIADISSIFPNRKGSGCYFRPLLERLKTHQDQAAISEVTLSSSTDAFSKTIAWDLISEQAVLITAFNDQPLPTEMGGPFRLLVPNTVMCGQGELDNCVNVKYLDQIAVKLTVD